MRYDLAAIIVCLVMLTTQLSMLRSQVIVYTQASSSIIGERFLDIRTFTVDDQQEDGTISGVVFLDSDDDGIVNPTEEGIADITVSVYDDTGLVTQTTSDQDGMFSFAGLDQLTRYQIIFEGWEDVYIETSIGPDNAGSIQQLFADGSAASLGLKMTDTSCEDPFIVIPCYVEGDIGTSGPEPAILRLPSSADGHDFEGVNVTPDYEAQVIATYDQVGTVYGLAWQQTTQRYYAGAFHKRYTSFGPEGPDAIYQLDLEGNLTGVINLDDLTSVNNVAGADVHDFTSMFNGSLLDLGVGNASFDGVGKRSFGDIEIDDEFSTLYVLNLFDRIIYALDVSSGVASATTIVNTWPSPDATGASRHRPFGLAWHEDLLWIGSVDENGSEAYVHSLDVQDGTFELELTFSLGYDRQAFIGAANNPDAPGVWNPWQSTPNFAPHEIDNEIGFPQAILSDIEFAENGDMILGFRDRFGDQGGAEKFFNVGDTEQTWVIAQGDILKACLSEGGSVVSPEQPSITIELENLSNQNQFAPFEVMTDPSASLGEFIVWPDNSGPLINNPTDNTPGQVAIDFTLTESTNVQFEIRVDFPNGGDNSFWYKLDDGPWQIQNAGITFGWQVISPTVFNNLDPGLHSLRILRREDGSQLDHVILSATSGSISSSLELSSLSVELEDLSDQVLFAPFEVMSDPQASNGSFIVWPNNSGPLVGNPTDNTPGQVSFDFITSEDAALSFEMTANFNGILNNSFWYKLDNGPWILQNNITTTGWATFQVNTINNLSAGSHTLRILRREDGSELDKARLIVSDGTITGTLSSEGQRFVLESGLSGNCMTINSGLTNSGPGGREFYYWDIYELPNSNWNPGAATGAFHWETAQGGLVQIPGSPHIVTTAVDPFDDFSGGILRLDNTTGAREGVPLVGPVNPNSLIGGYTIYESGDFDNGLPSANGFSAKANGLGDLESACAALYRIGNYVWLDADQDGRQDADEIGLSGVVVELYEDDVLIGRDTTDENGYYFFGGTFNHGLLNNTVLISGSSYQLRISLQAAQNNSNGEVGISDVTLSDQTDDRLDSDAETDGSIAFIDFTLDNTQFTDYSYDFGFTRCGVSSLSFLQDESVCQGEQLVVTPDIDGDLIEDHLWTLLSGTTSSGFILVGEQDSVLSVDAANATAGIIRLSYSAISDGCAVEDTMDVIVLSRPNIDIISSLDSTCTGEEVELTATTLQYVVNPQGGFVPPSDGPGFSQEHEIFNIQEPSATLVTITLPVWDDHFAETTLNGQVIFPEILEPDSWNAGGMDTERPWLPNVNGLPRSVIEITETSVRYFRTRTTTSTELEEVFPSNWVSTPQPFRNGDNVIEFGILNTAGPTGGSWTISAEAVVGYDFLWDTGDTTQTITDTPTSITDYMVTVTNTNNCSSVDSITIFAGTNNTESITYSGCSGDGYEVLVNGIIYNEANPTDTLVIATASGCDSTFFIDLQYDMPPVVIAGSFPSPLCSNMILNLDELNASITGGVTQGIWTSTGGGVFDNGGLFGGPNPATTYTPSTQEINAGKVILTLTSDDPPGSCEPEADAVMIIINDIRCNSFPWSGG